MANVDTQSEEKNNLIVENLGHFVCSIKKLVLMKLKFRHRSPRNDHSYSYIKLQLLDAQLAVNKGIGF